MSKKIKTISLRLTEEENEFLEYLAEYNGSSKSSEIRKVIRQMIREYEKEE